MWADEVRKNHSMVWWKQNLAEAEHKRLNHDTKGREGWKYEKKKLQIFGAVGKPKQIKIPRAWNKSYSQFEQSLHQHLICSLPPELQHVSQSGFPSTPQLAFDPSQFQSMNYFKSWI